MSLWRWLVGGSDVLTLPKSWLADTDRLAAYEAFTARQLQQGKVTRTVEELQAENAAIVAERERRLAQMQPSKVLRSDKFGNRSR